MSLPIRRPNVVLAALIVVVGALPPVFYWRTIGSAPSATAEEAHAALRAPEGRAALVDVRSPEEFAARPIAGSVNWPFEEIRRTGGPAGVPESLRGRRLFLICECGILSALAAKELTAAGVPDVFSVRGGADVWTPRYRSSPLHEQWAAVITGFGVKPFYMLLALVLAVLLRRAKATDLVALRWSLIFFFAGEAFCAINYGVFNDASYLSEYLHSFGMVVAFGFAAYAIFEGIDGRLIHYSDSGTKCASLSLCRACAKYAAAPCGLERCFLVAIPAAAVLAALPLAADPRPGSYLTTILGTQYLYSHPVVYQLFEIRICPVVAIALLALAFAALLGASRDPVGRSKFLFAAGAGFLGFGLFRLFLFAPFADNQVWFAFWEEVTELIFVVAVAAALWFFRRGLFLEENRV